MHPRWRPGDAKLTVDDWDVPGQTITLHLADPNQPPIEAAKELYSKARKASRGAATVGSLINEAEDQLQRLREAETQLLILEGPSDRSMIQDILVSTFCLFCWLDCVCAVYSIHLGDHRRVRPSAGWSTRTLDGRAEI